MDRRRGPARAADDGRREGAERAGRAAFSLERATAMEHGLHTDGERSILIYCGALCDGVRLPLRLCSLTAPRVASVLRDASPVVCAIAQGRRA